MLEGKTVNNIVDRYHRIITGDQNQIETGIQPEGTIQITENGTVDVTNYAEAEVNVSSQQYSIIEVTLNFTSQNYAGIVAHNVIEDGRLIDKAFTSSVSNANFRVKADNGTFGNKYKSFYITVYESASDTIRSATSTQGSIYSSQIGCIISGLYLDYTTLNITAKAD